MIFIIKTRGQLKKKRKRKQEEVEKEQQIATMSRKGNKVLLQLNVH